MLGKGHRAPQSVEIWLKNSRSETGATREKAFDAASTMSSCTPSVGKASSSVMNSSFQGPRTR
jgi:hypothetical protein